MAIHKIKKRNGTIVDFDIEKIENAIEKAAIASNPTKKSGSKKNSKIC